MAAIPASGGIKTDTSLIGDTIGRQLSIANGSLILSCIPDSAVAVADDVQKVIEAAKGSTGAEKLKLDTTFISDVQLGMRVRYPLDLDDSAQTSDALMLAGAINSCFSNTFRTHNTKSKEQQKLSMLIARYALPLSFLRINPQDIPALIDKLEAHCRAAGIEIPPRNPVPATQIITRAPKLPFDHSTQDRISQLFYTTTAPNTASAPHRSFVLVHQAINSGVDDDGIPTYWSGGVTVNELEPTALPRKTGVVFTSNLNMVLVVPIENRQTIVDQINIIFVCATKQMEMSDILKGNVVVTEKPSLAERSKAWKSAAADSIALMEKPVMESVFTRMLPMFNEAVPAVKAEHEMTGEKAKVG